MPSQKRYTIPFILVSVHCLHFLTLAFSPVLILCSVCVCFCDDCHFFGCDEEKQLEAKKNIIGNVKFMDVYGCFWFEFYGYFYGNYDVKDRAEDCCAYKKQKIVRQVGFFVWMCVQNYLTRMLAPQKKKCVLR